MWGFVVLGYPKDGTLWIAFATDGEVSCFVILEGFIKLFMWELLVSVTSTVYCWLIILICVVLVVFLLYL